MRPQDDYLRDFAVLMTEKGVVAVSDPMQIAIYDYLCGGSKRPIDIAEALDIPTSSMHFVLDKMVDSGVLAKTKPDPSRKEVYYYVLAQKIAGSTTPTQRDIEASEEAFRNPDRYYKGLSSVANMLESYTNEIGLDLSQMRAAYARDLAAAVKDDIGKGSLESVMQAVKARYTQITGFKMSVYGLEPLTLILEGDSVMSSKVDMLSLLVKDMIENATDRTLEVRSVEDLSVEGTARFKVTYERSVREPEPYLNTTLPQMAEPEKFVIMEIDGTASLLMNDIQNKLVDAIYERPLCVTDIVNMVDMPRSTVTTNLLRMVEEGIVSVFYSESGAMYYGLSCSILMKRVRRVSKDRAPVREAVKGATADGAFMEGYLKYLLASFQVLGFDTDYMMVVLGAKYMRAAGKDGPRNFDAYFGKMSDIADVFGLSLSVVSVYPLTIGISKEDEGSVLAPAMTFVKGMAHQGLEMASSGIFVRVSEETPEDMRVSFKEIYPSLSMSPSAETEEAVPDVVPVRKKRTSSVRDALRNRSAKTDGRPSRTVRYITGMTLAVFVAAILIVGISGVGTDNIASASTYELDVDADGVYLVDADGEVMETPAVLNADASVTFSIGNEDGLALGTVSDGVAVLLDDSFSNGDGTYTVQMTSDVTIVELRQVGLPDGLSAYIYDFGRDVDVSYAYGFDGYYAAEDYAAASGALWASEDAYVWYVPEDGCYVSVSDDDSFYLDGVCIGAWEDAELGSAELPSDYAVLELVGAYEVDGYYVEGSLKVERGADLTLAFVSTDGPVVLYLEQDGRETSLALSLYRTVTFSIDSDATIAYAHTVVQ